MSKNKCFDMGRQLFSLYMINIPFYIKGCKILSD